MKIIALILIFCPHLKNPPKNANDEKQFFHNSENHKYHFGKKWHLEINVGLKIG
jgi:hypothetical protein